MSARASVACAWTWMSGGALSSVAIAPGERLARVLPVFLVGVVSADGEGDLRGLVGVRVAVVLLVLLHVGDGEVFLTEPEAKDDGVGEGLVAPFTAGAAFSLAYRSYQSAALS